MLFAFPFYAYLEVFLDLLLQNKKISVKPGSALQTINKILEPAFNLSRGNLKTPIKLIKLLHVLYFVKAICFKNLITQRIKY